MTGDGSIRCGRTGRDGRGAGLGCLPLCALALFAVVASAAGATGGQVAGVPRAGEGLIESVLFYVFGGMTLVSALGAAVTRSIVRMALWLFGTLGSVAILYFLMAANFLGAIQLIVYVGGTLVLLIFGVMLTTRSPAVRFEVSGKEIVAAWMVCVLLLIGLIATFAGEEWSETARVEGVAVVDFGKALLTTYLVPFEAVSVLLLVVMIGAAYLARPERESGS